jgi:hypothetical protein
MVRDPPIQHRESRENLSWRVLGHRACLSRSCISPFSGCAFFRLRTQGAFSGELLGENMLWGLEMELQRRLSGLILEGISHCRTTFLKILAIGLCPWNQERIICTRKRSGDPKNIRLYLGKMPLEVSVLSLPMSQPPSSALPSHQSIQFPHLAKICGSE